MEEIILGNGVNPAVKGIKKKLIIYNACKEVLVYQNRVGFFSIPTVYSCYNQNEIKQNKGVSLIEDEDPYLKVIRRSSRLVSQNGKLKPSSIEVIRYYYAYYINSMESIIDSAYRESMKNSYLGLPQCVSLDTLLQDLTLQFIKQHDYQACKVLDKKLNYLRY